MVVTSNVQGSASFLYLKAITEFAELEQQLEIAETRCDTLKQQLDYMKMLYEGIGDQKDESGQHKSAKKCKEDCKCPAGKPGTTDMSSDTYASSAVGKRTGRSSRAGRKSRCSRNGDRSEKADVYDIDVVKQPCPYFEADEYDVDYSAGLVLKPDLSSKTDFLRPDVDMDTSIPELVKMAMAAEHGEPIEGLLEAAAKTGEKKSQKNVPESKITITRYEENSKEKPRDESYLELPADPKQSILDEIFQAIQNHKLREASGDNDRPDKTKVEKHKPRNRQPKNQARRREILDEEHRQVLNVGKSEKHKHLTTSCSDSELHQLRYHGKSAEDTHTAKPMTSRECNPKSLNVQSGSAESIRDKRKAKKNDKKQKPLGPYTNISNKIKGKRKTSEELISVTCSRLKKKRDLSRCSNTRNIISRADKYERNNDSRKSECHFPDEEVVPYSNIPCTPWQSDKVVELYHNRALKTDTETRVSDQSFDVRETRQLRSRLTQTARTNLTELSDPKLCRLFPSEPTDDYFTLSGGECYPRFDVDMTDEFGAEEEGDEEVSSQSGKRRSGKKGPPKFDFRNIPFVVGKSTTPSHNLGLNIQQALSIIKLRQVPNLPMSCLCPRYGAKNAVLAAEGRPTTFGFVLSHQMKKRPCSSLSGRGDEDSDKFVCQKGPGSRTRSRSGSAENSKSKCVCHPKNIVDYHQILNNYLEPSADQLSFLKKGPVQLDAGGRPATSSVSGKRVGSEKTFTMEGDGGGQYFYSNLKGRVRELRNILRILHDDFSRLHRRYQSLQSGVKSDAIAQCDAVEQLLEIEEELRAKEDEITVVMSLYREINALKEQIKALREKTSLAATNITSRQTIPCKRGASREGGSASIRLIKLLRQIQQFQERLRNE